MSAPNYPEIPPEAFGGKRPPADELRFYRLIEEKYKSKDGIEDVKLACGHLMSYPASLPPSQEYAYCLTCLHAWTERSRQARENIIPEPEYFSADQWTEEQRRQIAERQPPGPTINRLTPEPPEMEQERALLRRLLNSRDPLENARLTFRNEKHRMIFQRIMDLHERAEPVDRVALANELMRNGELQAVGGLTYLVSLYEPPAP